MRTKERLIEVIDTLNDEAVGEYAVIILAIACDALTGKDMEKVLKEAVQRLAEVHHSQYIRQLAGETYAHLNGDDYEVSKETG